MASELYVFPHLPLYDQQRLKISLICAFMISSFYVKNRFRLWNQDKNFQYFVVVLPR
jgi:hypothetical protein